MADKEHLARLKQGVEAWNQWRKGNPNIQPDLVGADLSKADLGKANLSEADLHEANLSEANLSEANLGWADLGKANLSKANLSHANLSKAFLGRAYLVGVDLIGAHLSEANFFEANLSEAALSQTDLVEARLSGADLSGAILNEANLTRATLKEANLSKANLTRADLTGTDLSKANLRWATLEEAILIQTNLAQSDLTDCSVYGVSVWKVQLEGAHQTNLVITPSNEPTITVDNLEVAQFIYLLLNNQKIRDVIDTITSKVVLILGRFTAERKAVLDAIREELRHRDYLPVLFDFEKPASRDLTETISTLAHMARFIIADLTEAKSIPQELQRIVPDLPSVPVQPVLRASVEEYSLFEHFKRFPWVLETYQYESLEEVIAALTEKVIAPAELKANELLRRVRG
jgi:uncharacterized protein YjbI with pentapeptide repeats